MEYNPIQASGINLFAEIRLLIELTKSQVAVTVNSAMTIMYWRIGDRINREVLGGERAAYGKQIVATLSRQLTEEYGRGFDSKNLHRMMQFANVFPDEQIVAPLARQLSWSHFLQVISIADDLKRNFYLTMAADQKWSRRTLKAKIDSMLYERTAIAKSAIVADLQNFIIELGNDFAFMARQKRISIDDEDYYIDLLFYHRRLRCLVAIDLKLGKFQAAYKGQMELYLRWLENHEMLEGENKPIGLILCAGKNEEHIELMHLNESNIRVAEYLTRLPSRSVLEAKLQQAIERARTRLANSDYE
ncbi:MAG: PDDEXK nuclease domain-containing protein [Prevotella sp.]|nr:PDDEXK nuclease domain-containing protein [Prevotella sp.]